MPRALTRSYHRIARQHAQPSHSTSAGTFEVSTIIRKSNESKRRFPQFIFRVSHHKDEDAPEQHTNEGRENKKAMQKVVFNEDSSSRSGGTVLSHDEDHHHHEHYQHRERVIYFDTSLQEGQETVVEEEEELVIPNYRMQVQEDLKQAAAYQRHCLEIKLMEEMARNRAMNGLAVSVDA